MAGFAGTALLLASRVVETYAAAWAIGLPALLFLLLAGAATERMVLALLLVLSLLLGGEQGELGLRQTLFLALFMLFARYLVVEIAPALLLYALGFAVSSLLIGMPNTLFLLAPVVLLLLAASVVRHRARTQARPLTGPEQARVAALTLVGFVLPFLGSGSRGALFVWVADAIRRLSLPMLLIGALGAAAVLSIPGLLIVDKLANSLDEILSPVSDAGLGISMRGIETLVFLGWWETATPAELLFGSPELLYLPGTALGREDDVAFIPHNQLFGLLFQFGLTGLIAIAVYFRFLWRHQAGYRPGRFLLFALMLPGFLVLGGFITTDYAILAAAVNGLAHRWAPARR
jgi:hypothetical protein